MAEMSKWIPRVGEWISVKDMLPKPSFVESDNESDPYQAEMVLVFIPNKSDHPGYIVQAVYEVDPIFRNLSRWLAYIVIENYANWEEIEEPTHWMPLPEPPKWT